MILTYVDRNTLSSKATRAANTMDVVFSIAVGNSKRYVRSTMNVNLMDARRKVIVND